MVYSCINLHFTDFCNYNCKHCFVKKDNYELSFEQLKIIIDKIDKYFKKNNIAGRINLAGGEPLMSRNIDRIIEYIYSKNIKISIITNGYYLDERFIQKHKEKIEMIGISVDSLNHETNIKIGRCFKTNTISKEQLIYISKLIKDANIKLKINTCISKININENFNDFINEIKPDRFKILQMLCSSTDVKNSKNEVSDEEINIFLSKINYEYIYESKDNLKNSYLIIDSLGNISTNNSHSSNISIFDYELENAINLLDINYQDYIKRYI